MFGNGSYNRQLSIKLAIIFSVGKALAIPSGFGRSRIRRNCDYTLLWVVLFPFIIYLNS